MTKKWMLENRSYEEGCGIEIGGCKIWEMEWKNGIRFRERRVKWEEYDKRKEKLKGKMEL